MNFYDPNHQETRSKHFGQRKKEQDAVARISTAIKNVLAELSGQEERRAAFLRLLACIRGGTALLKPTPGRGSTGWVASVFLIKRLKNVALRNRFWFRACETWVPDQGNIRPAFRSLMHHLFAYYSIPGFMDSVWDLTEGPDAFRQQAWCIRLGRGDSLRCLNTPIPLTRRMEHYARRGPDHHTAIQAMRYGEMRGLGGSEHAAREIAESRLGYDTARPTFWRTVLMFFAAHAELPVRDHKAIIDFIHANKFAVEKVLTANGLESRAAPWPEFSIHGRTPQSLLQLVRAWRLESGGGAMNGCSWPQSGIRAYRYVEQLPGETQLDWSIVELLNSSALYAEGRAMHHCVYDYANKCLRGSSAIWSLRLQAEGHEKRMATIEVSPRRRVIVQVRAKSNRRPGHRFSEIIRQWAALAGLQ